MSKEEVWIDWSPPWCTHIKGRYTTRVLDEESGMPEPQKVEMRCEFPNCNGFWKTVCSTGSVRTHITRFASAHFHTDPFGKKLFMSDVEKVKELLHLVLKGDAQADLELVRGLISEECHALNLLLQKKNRDYGNSAINPLRIFSKADPEEQIKVRMDDKLSRIARGDAAGEDTELDLIGYLLILRVARKRKELLDRTRHVK